MKKSGLLKLVIFLVLLLSCPLLAQAKTDDTVFIDPGFDLGQVASGSLNYQRYGPNDCGSEAEGYESWGSDSENYQSGQYEQAKQLASGPIAVRKPKGMKAGEENNH